MNYRYPGVKPFSADEQNIFFGRENDIKKLYELIDLEKLVLLYGKSGLGKSSLINAGIIPKLQNEGHFVPVIIRFGSHIDDSQTPVNIISQRIAKDRKFNTLLDKIIPNENSLWYYFKSIQIEELSKLHKSAHAKNKTSNYILIFDQFEELFTFTEAGIKDFKKQIAELLYAKVPKNFREELDKLQVQKPNLLTEEEFGYLHTPLSIKILASIRSDKMSLLNKLTDYIPNILRKFYELSPLTRIQAEDAILNPAYSRKTEFVSPPFDYYDDTLKTMLDFLTKNNEQPIETFQLQILCQHCENIVIKEHSNQADPTKIQQIHKDELGNIEDIFKNHYDDLIARLDTDDERIAARKLIEDGLIFEEEERRIPLLEGIIFKRYKISKDLLQKLVNTHLLRAEPNTAGGFSYEISHDTLVKPILQSKAIRLEKERIEQEKLIALEKQRELQRQQTEKLRKVFRTLLTIAVCLIVALAVILYFKNDELKVKNGDLQKANQQITDAYIQLSKLITLDKSTTGDTLALSDQLKKAQREAQNITDRISEFQTITKKLDSISQEKNVTAKEIVKIVKEYNSTLGVLRENNLVRVINSSKVVNDNTIDSTKRDVPKEPKKEEVKEVAVTIENAKSFFEKQQYKEAFEMYSKLSKSNNSEATYYVGYMYFRGFYVGRNIQLAQNYFKSAAATGNPNALLEVGNMHFLNKEYSEALECYRKVEKNPIAQYNIGVFLENGYGVIKNQVEAIKWYEKSAKGGNANAKKALQRLGKN